jgi:hypothetical protein
LFNAGGTVVNLAGTIGAGKFAGVGIYMGPGTVVNFATIEGGTAGAAVDLSPNFTDRVAIGTGAVFTGVVNGGNTIGATSVSTLELTTGSSAGVVGTITGIGSKYIDFADIVVDAGASWVFAGGQTIAANETLTDNGTLTNNATVLTTVTLGSGASLTNASGGVISSQGGKPLSVVGLSGPATVTNYGHILASATGAGVALFAGGTVINRGGTLTGADGVEITGGGGTVVNFATILGINSNFAGVFLGAGYQNLLAIAPGSTIVGVANGGNTIGATSVSTLELTTGTAAGVIGTVGVIGTLGGVGAQYVQTV